ncbi:MAG TPA: PEP-utilizing enzyme [Candidatus Paceibacterota bacterium]
MKNERIYSRYFARDFTLPLIETWARAETTDPRQWTKKTNPELPFQIFIRENGIVTDYFNPKGLDWINSELRRLIKKDKKFVEKIAGEFNQRARLIKPVWAKRKTLNHAELVKYLVRLRDVWAWYEAIWWIMEMVDPKSREFKLTHTARINNERMIPDSDVVIRKSLRKIYPKLGALANTLLLKEIVSNKLPSKQELEDRAKKYSFANAKLYTGKGIPDMEKIFDIDIVSSEKKTNISEFKGKVAYPGIARGKVRIIKKREEVSKLKEGEVLVSPMTMPDYVVAMKRAVAIVTDEGGVTCHAAIVARELKKPCIIGTKIATEILSDGDLIEVDANKGLVTIIKRH